MQDKIIMSHPPPRWRMISMLKKEICFERKVKFIISLQVLLPNMTYLGIELKDKNFLVALQ